jgi:leucyl aminopeptidase
MTSATALAASLKTLDVDAVVIGIAAGDDGPVPLGGTAELDAALGGKLAKVLADVGATGRAGEVVRFATLGAIQAGSVVAVGVGPQASAGDHEALRRAAGAATRALAGSRVAASTLALSAGPASAESVRAAAEGGLLGAYSFDAFRTTSAKGRAAPVSELLILVDEAEVPSASAAVRHATVVTEAVRLVRDLVNTPPGHLPPARLAEIAEQEAKAAGLLVEVLDEKALAEGGFGGLVGVGQGSTNPPRLVRLEWHGGEAAADAPAVLALVGKGITFDSGGLSLKPPASMEWMKTDMAGAASVLASLVAVAKLEVPARIVGWMACAENMPSGTAIRPGDVITLKGGTRVEVLNTDAEGRLVLGDALVRAGEEQPAMMVDIATLTGAQIVALGHRTTGLMGRDEAVEAVAAAARGTGESVWPMPMPPELRKSLDSTVADLANVPPSGSRDGGMLTASHFLAAFVPDDIPWAHLDIAGPSWNGGEAYGHTPKAATGAIVRTLIQLAEDRAAS